MESKTFQATLGIGDIRRSINETLSNLFDGKRKVDVTVSQEAGEYRLQIVHKGVVACLLVQEIGGRV